MTNISVLCATYGRPRDLEELLHCFLKQDHQDATLYIYNDCPYQELDFSHPRVAVYNREERFRSLGQKRQYMLETVPDGLVTFWDDDDIYLPDHLSYSLAWHAKFKTPVSKHMAQWYDGGYRLYRIGAAGWMNTVLADRTILLDVGGFDPVHHNTCVGIIQRLVRSGHINGPAHPDERCPTFIYRIKDGRNHISTTADTEAYSCMESHADPEQGVIHLVPQWSQDYVAKAKASWEALP